MAISWYGVKLLHKFTILGTPDNNKIDEFFHENDIFFEESILLVKAKSFDEAYEIAENTAQKENNIYENKYGQTVKREFYESIDCFCMFDSPSSTVEVYSSIFSKKNEDEKLLLDKRYEYCTAEEMHMLRFAFKEKE